MDAFRNASVMKFEPTTAKRTGAAIAHAAERERRSEPPVKSRAELSES